MKIFNKFISLIILISMLLSTCSFIFETSTVTALESDSSDSNNSKLPKHLIVGYCHNWQSDINLKLSDIPQNYDIICVAFTENESVSFELSPDIQRLLNYSVQDFKDEIQMLSNRGQQVIISVGGANGRITIDSDEASDKFAKDMMEIIDEYGFKGIDIDLEGSTVTGTKYIGNALRKLHDHYGDDFIITMAPETAYISPIPTGYGTYYWDLAMEIKDILTICCPQFYNSGSMFGYQGDIVQPGTADFVSRLSTLYIESGLRPDQIAMGLPAIQSISGQYLNPDEMEKAFNSLVKGEKADSFTPPKAYPDYRGFMNCSINWDAKENYSWSKAARQLINDFEKTENDDTGDYFDDFSSDTLNTDKWIAIKRAWGPNNNGVVPENISIEDGHLHLEAHGDNYTGNVPGVRTDDGKRTGAAISTKEYFGSGSYEIRAKVPREYGACSAMWTFEYESYVPGDPVYEKYANEGDEYYAVNHEIDIELPGRPSAEHEGISYQYALCNTWVGEREDEYTSDHVKLDYPVNDGEYHNFRFDWHTGSDTEQKRVEFYIDGKLVSTSTTHIPTNKGRFWIGIWFPNKWAGDPDFDKVWFDVDYVKITPFNEPGDTINTGLLIEDIDPDDPIEPDNPVEPDKPDNPVEPDKPDNPVEPDKPDNPVEPDKPDNPVEPDKPDNPTDSDDKDKIKPNDIKQEEKTSKDDKNVIISSDSKEIDKKDYPETKDNTVTYNKIPKAGITTITVTIGITLCLVIAIYSFICLRKIK